MRRQADRVDKQAPVSVNKRGQALFFVDMSTSGPHDDDELRYVHHWQREWALAVL
jgi:hypothetical protein